MFSDRNIVVHIKSPMFKNSRMRKYPELWFTTNRLIILQSLILPFKANGSRARVNHARELEFVQSEDFNPIIFLLLYGLNVNFVF